MATRNGDHVGLGYSGWWVTTCEELAF